MLLWLLGGAVALGLRWILPKRLSNQGLIVASPTQIASRRYLYFFLLPLWIVPGFLDYVWHRRTKIETTAGTRESICHALMMIEAGIPVTMSLFFEVNAGLLLTMIGAFVAHTATTWYDVSYASTRRDTRPAEQHIHSFLEVLPLTNLSFAIAMHWDQFEALFGAGSERPDFKLRWKKPMLSPAYISGLIGAITLFIAIPYAEELWRCYRAEREGLTGTETPEWLRERAIEEGDFEAVPATER